MSLFSHDLNPLVKRLPKPGKFTASYAFPMDNIYGIRRKNLDALLALPALSGLQMEVDKADLLGVSKSMWSQLKNPDYNIGDPSARRIEAALGLQENWMDNTHGQDFFSLAGSHFVGIEADTLRTVLQITQATAEAMGVPFLAHEQAELILSACQTWQSFPGSETAKASRVTVAIMDGLRGISR